MDTLQALCGPGGSAVRRLGQAALMVRLGRQRTHRIRGNAAKKTCGVLHGRRKLVRCVEEASLWDWADV